MQQKDLIKGCFGFLAPELSMHQGLVEEENISDITPLLGGVYMRERDCESWEVVKIANKGLTSGELRLLLGRSRELLGIAPKMHSETSSWEVARKLLGESSAGEKRHRGKFIREEKKHTKTHIFCQWSFRSGEGTPTLSGGQGSWVYVLSSEPKEHKSFVQVLDREEL